jgi:hypothetical protein
MQNQNKLYLIITNITELCDVSACNLKAYLHGVANHFNNSNVYSRYWQTLLRSFCNILCFAVFTWHTLTFGSVHKSSWLELITECTFNFVVSATARSTTGTGFLDLQVGWLAVFPDCSTKKPAVWFPGSASCYNCSEGVLAVSDLSNSFWYTNTWLILLTVEQPRHKLCTDLSHVQVLCYSFQFSAMFHKIGLTCQKCPKYTVLVDDLHFLHIFVCVACVRTAWTLTLFNQSFPTLNQQNHSKVYVLHTAL